MVMSVDVVVLCDAFSLESVLMKTQLDLLIPV
jgi:hypothetical protein